MENYDVKALMEDCKQITKTKIFWVIITLAGIAELSVGAILCALAVVAHRGFLALFGVFGLIMFAIYAINSVILYFGIYGEQDEDES